MGGQAKDEESARRAAVEMGWVDEHYLWTPENPAPPELAEIAGLQRPPGGVGEGLGTGLPNDVDYRAIELRVLAFLQQEAADERP